MQIDYNILRAYGGVAKKVTKDELIYEEGAIPRFYHQVIEGEVMLFCSNTEGKELTQGTFSTGKSFGEPSLLIEKVYPNTARATTDSVIVKITKSKLFNIFRDYPEMSESLLITFAERIYNNASHARIWVSPNPEEKILRFLDIYYPKAEHKDREEVSQTRQQIANYTGLRVETVIRTLKKMSGDGKVAIINRKLFY